MRFVRAVRKIDVGGWLWPRAVIVPSLLAVLALLGACGTVRSSFGRMAGRTSPSRPAAGSGMVTYAGRTTQGRTIVLLVDHDRSVLIALRFSISYSCAGRGRLALRALILRPDDAFGIVNRSPSGAAAGLLGFSDWFSGPIGHDFHLTGTLSADERAVSGTLHSLLPSGGGHGRCDSGELTYTAWRSAPRFAMPAAVMITLARYRQVPSGITVTDAERLLGRPNDRDIFHPRVVITGTLPAGVPGAQQAWLDYGWRGHPHRYFQFFFRAGRLIRGSSGRSISSS